MMLRGPFLRNLLLLALAITASMPLYTLLVLHPAYHEQLIHETEDEATRFATYLSKSLHIDKLRIDREHLPPDLADQMTLLDQDRHLIKLRFFSPEGEIVHSTDADEIGKANTKDYFRNIVAKGQIYSKVVESDRLTAEGIRTKIDVVETYVPFMVSGKFNGAIEIYYDISRRVAKINTLTLKSTLIVASLSLIFLLAMILALGKAKVALDERERAEHALVQANQELEQRVAERTAEFIEANAQLTNEIAERTMAQAALSQALEDLRRDREKLDGILRSVNDGLVVVDHQLNVLHMNNAAEKLLDLSLERALGQPLDRMGRVAGLAGKVRAHLAEACISATFDFELPGASSKQPIVYEARFSQLESDQGEPGVVLLIHDVTRERELDRLKSAFLGMAAHELNTPLAAILGFSELLVQSEGMIQITDEQRDEYLQLIHTKALELSRLIDDLLDISRVEAGQSLLLGYESLPLEEMLRDVLLPYQERSPRHRFELHFTTARTEIEADGGRLRQVFNNLISNAVKYSPQGGLIRVAVDDADGCCQVTVTDEGIGMTAEQVQHIFDRFYRADNSNTAVQGVGLGMSIVRHIVEAHHGKILVESQLGRGTVIRVKLPFRAVA